MQDNKTKNSRWTYKGFTIYQKYGDGSKSLYDVYDRTGQLKFKNNPSLFNAKIKVDDFISFNTNN